MPHSGEISAKLWAGFLPCTALESFVSKDGALVGVLYHTELTSGECFFFLGRRKQGLDAFLRFLSTLCNRIASILHRSGNELQSFLILPEIREKNSKKLELRFAICSIMMYNAMLRVGIGIGLVASCRIYKSFVL